MSEKQFALHRQIHFPTGVSHSICAFFTKHRVDDTSLPNLILVRSTLLEVYELGVDDVGVHHRLELIDQYPLSGVVESLVVLKNASTKQIQRDSIILTYREAKVAVLEWRPDENSVAVTSLHSFEDELQHKDGREVFPLGPEAKTDPLGRCACVLFFENRLALLMTKDTEDLEVSIADSKTTNTTATNTASASQAASICSSYVLQLHTLGIREVLDFVFLHGYNEPVLLLLHESSPTWAAQYREKKDTRGLTAVSLNLKQKIYPVIWSVKNLPSDAYKLIPTPLAGSLVLSMNFIAFYSQGQTMAVGVNSQAFATEIPQKIEIEGAGNTSTSQGETVHATISAAAFARTYATAVHAESAPLLSQNAAKGILLDVELDAAVACWLNNLTMLLALKTGKLLLVQMIIDRDNVKDITLTKCGSAPLVSCLTVIGEDLLFIGSCQGDSLLVKFNPLEEQLPPSKVPVSTSTILDDDLFFFGDDVSESTNSVLTQHQFSFSVIDTLFCLGPIRDMVTGAPPESDAASQQTSQSPQLVCCVGTGRSGALVIMRKGIVAEVLIEVPVPGIEAVWALHYTEESEHLPVSVTSYATNAFLVISTSTRTMVLRSGEELEEVSDNSDFEVETSTVLAGSLLEDMRIVQICQQSIRVLQGIYRTQDINLQDLLNQLSQGPDVVMASSQQEDTKKDPTPEQKSPSPEPMEVEEPNQEQRNMFYDFGALGEDSFGAEFLIDDKYSNVEDKPVDLLPVDHEEAAKRSGPWIQGASICDPLVLLKLADGRVLLLEADKETKRLNLLETALDLMFHDPMENESAQITAAELFSDRYLWLNHGRESAIYKNPVFVLVCRKSGFLEIYALPHMTCILTVEAFSMGWRILKENNISAETRTTLCEGKTGPLPRVHEIRMNCFQKNTKEQESLISKPFLIALLDDGTLLIYSAFYGPDGSLAFRRLDLDYTGDAAWSALHSKDSIRSLGKRPKLVPFHDMGEKHPCNGLFVSGVAPYFIIFSSKGVAPHRLLVDGPVSAMTPFSNINCPKGFILAMSNNQLKICTFHKERIDGCWPYNKIPLRCTPNKVAWYPDSKLYILLVSRPILFRERLAEEEGGDAHAAAAYIVSEQVAREKGMEEGHEIRIVNPLNWSTAWSFPLDPNESALAVRAVRLKNQSDDTIDAFIAIGTAYVLGHTSHTISHPKVVCGVGEDYPCTGRILLLEVGFREQRSHWEGRISWSQECRAPVNAVAVLDGSLLMGIGSRLELCAWNGSGLMRLAFFDAPVFITSVNVVKNFVLFGDFLKGIHFVWYTIPTSRIGGGHHETHGEVKEMILLGKDFNNSDVYATEFLVNGTTLRFISADGGGNLQLQGYHRDHPDSWNGRKLMPEGSIHVGHLITKMLRMRLCSLDGIGRQAALYGTMEGSIGFVSPLWDASLFDRLYNLQKTLLWQTSHVSGLNPAAFRKRFKKPVRSGLCGWFGKLHQNPPDVILDLDLIWKYLTLDRIQQEDLANKSVTHRQQIIQDLQSISLTTSFF